MSLIPPQTKALILDMDGVLWKDNQPLVDLPKVFAQIHALGLQVVLATNNATRSVDMYQQKLASLGVSVEPWQIITSSHAVVHLLQQSFPDGCPVYILGEKGLVDSLAQAGYPHVESNVQAVIVGLDRSLSFEKLKIATMLINGGALFIGTNQDNSFPTPQGPIPGAGAVIAAVATAVGFAPIFAGKPNPTMYQIAFQRLNIAPSEALAVGDRLETDIAGGIQSGCQTTLVLSGIATVGDLASSTTQPDIVTQDLAALVGL